MDSVEKVNSGNNLRDSKSGYRKNYGKVFRYCDAVCKYVETGDKKMERRKKGGKVRPQSF
jgi:hypothetical protein